MISATWHYKYSGRDTNIGLFAAFVDIHVARPRQEFTFTRQKKNGDPRKCLLADIFGVRLSC